MADSTPKVFTAIAAVMAEIGTAGISKDRRNQQQGYNFRGIDEVYNALSPILAKHKLCILPRILTREVVERTTQKGGALFYVTVEAEFDLISAEDGSKHTIRTFGEAMDSADKATNKAMSAAYKYAAMQTFCIPTEGDNDADAQHHDVAPRQPQDTAPSVSPDEVAAFSNTIKAASTLEGLQGAFAAAWKAVGDPTQRQSLKADYEARKAKLTPADDFPGDQKDAA
jgi:glutamine synthetase